MGDFVAEVKPISFWKLTRLEIEKAWAAVKYLGPVLMLVGDISNGPFWFLSLNDNNQRQEEEEEVKIGNLRAVESAIRHKFDGYDNDRRIIQQRYL